MKLVPILFLLVFIALFITIMPNIFGSFEVQHNVTVLNASGYGNTTDEYEAGTSIIQINMSVLMGIGTLLVIAMLFILAKIML